MLIGQLFMQDPHFESISSVLCKYELAKSKPEDTYIHLYYEFLVDTINNARRIGGTRLNIIIHLAIYWIHGIKIVEFPDCAPVKKILSNGVCCP